MNPKEILKEAFDSDKDLFAKCLESDEEILKQSLTYISKIIIKLNEKGIFTLDDMEDLLSNNEMNKQIEEAIKDVKIKEN